MVDDPIRVLIADDHSVVRKGLKYVFLTADDIELVGEAGNGEEAVKLSKQLKPDIVIMDIMMPKMDGITAIKKIRTSIPETKVIALTSFDEKEIIVDAIRAGAVSTGDERTKQGLLAEPR